METADNPMPQNFEELEQLVQRFYQPGPSQDINKIQSQLQKWQRSEAGWEVAERLLGSSDPNVRFFGALTITVKLNLDWEKLDTENGPSSETVLSGLITTIIHSVNRNEAPFVLRKLCTSLVTYFCRPISNWSFPIRQLVCAFHEGHFVPENMVQTVTLTEDIMNRLNTVQITTVLWFATYLVQEITKLDLPEQRVYHERMPKNAVDAQMLLSFTLEYGGSTKIENTGADPSVGLSESALDVRKTALTCFASWTEYCQNEWTSSPEELSTITALIPQAVMDVYVGVEDAELTFIGLLTECKDVFDSRPAENGKNLLYELILSDWTKSRLIGLDEAEPSSIGFGRFIIAFAEMEADTLLKEGAAERSKGLLALVHHMSKYSCADQYEDNIVVNALEFWASYVEGAVDDLIEGGATHPPWLGAARNEVGQAIRELLTMIVFPSSEISSTWDGDTRKAFQTFRQDFGDMLESAYILLGQDLTKSLTDATQEHLANRRWRPLEASMYCLNKLADTVCDDAEDNETAEEALLCSLFRSPLFAELSSNPGIPRRLLKTSVDMLACYSRLFKKHVDLLPSALNFLFSSLQVPHLANDAARSISTLCSSCRQSLISELPAFVQQYDAFRATPTADVYTKEKVIGGISAIVQAVPSHEDRISHVSNLLSFIEQDIRHMVELVASRDIEHGLVKAQAAIECLANMGKALQSPDDALLGKPLAANASTAASWLPIQQRIIRCVDMATQVLAEDSDLLEQACNVLRAGYKEKQYGPFVLPASATVNFVTRTTLQTPRLPVILATAQTFVKYHIDRMKPEFAQDARILLQHVLSLMKALSDPSQDPEVSQSLIDLLGAFTQSHMSILKNELGPDLEYAFRFTIASLRGPDVLPKRASTGFWGNLLTVCSSGKPEDQVLAKEILQYFVAELCDALVYQISGDAPQSALDYVSVPLTRLIGVQRNMRQMIDQSLSKRYGPDPIEGARAKFLQAILSAKGITARKVIFEFWQACRRHALATSSSRSQPVSESTGSALNPQLIE